jgi:hypothetical protein
MLLRGNLVACEVPPRDWRAGITPGRVAVAVVAGSLAAGAIALDTDQISSLLFTVAALLFATKFGVSVAPQRRLVTRSARCSPPCKTGTSLSL